MFGSNELSVKRRKTDRSYKFQDISPAWELRNGDKVFKFTMHPTEKKNFFGGMRRKAIECVSFFTPASPFHVKARPLVLPPPQVPSTCTAARFVACVTRPTAAASPHTRCHHRECLVIADPRLRCRFLPHP